MQLRSRTRANLESSDTPQKMDLTNTQVTQHPKRSNRRRKTFTEENVSNSELIEPDITSQEISTNSTVLHDVTQVVDNATSVRRSTRRSTNSHNTLFAEEKSQEKTPEGSSLERSEISDFSEEIDSAFDSDLSDFESLPKSTPRKRGKTSKGKNTSTPKKRRTPTKSNDITDTSVLSEGPVDDAEETQPRKTRLRSELSLSPPPLPTPVETNSEETFDLELDLNPQLESETESVERHSTPTRKRHGNSDRPLANDEKSLTQKKHKVMSSQLTNAATVMGNLDHGSETDDIKLNPVISAANSSTERKVHNKQNASGSVSTEEINNKATIVKSKFFENLNQVGSRKILGKISIKSEDTSFNDGQQLDHAVNTQLGISTEQRVQTNSADLPNVEDGKAESHESGEESEEEDWEEVTVPGNSSENSATVTESRVSIEEPKFKTLTITLDTPKVKQRAKSSGLSKMERLIRLETHKAHLLCLLGNGIYRNRLCNNSELRGLGLSALPHKLYESLSLETRKDTTAVKNSRFLVALDKLASWWYSYFEVIDSECQLQDQEEIVDSDTIMNSMDMQHLINSFNYPRGSAEISTQLFVALCRAIGLSARLIISLQPVPLKTPGNSSKNSSNPSSATSSPKPTKKPGQRKGKQKSASTSIESIKEEVTASKSKYFGQNREVEGEPPLFWAEILSPYNKKWISVDCVRGFVNRITEMEPSADSPYSLAYVIAFESDASIKDVTRRYTRHWGAKTKKLRVPITKDGYDWWAETMAYYARQHRSQADELEDAELLSCEVSEAMPTSIAAFNNHPLYVLERHLKKFEVLYPKEPVIGHIRGEPIYPRSCVKETHTAETWLKEGRTVKSGEEPIKYVKARVVTINKQRMHNMMAMDSGEPVDPQSALYGIWQTEEYKPPPVVNGKIPKNNYGNIDLYKDSMLPEGAVHLPFKGIARIARRLEVDYAEAVVGFEFHCRRCIPVVKGIVVPIESKEIVMEAYEEYERNRQEKEYTKLEIAALAKWRKLITGLRIHHRLKEEYGNEPQEEILDEVDDHPDAELGAASEDVGSPAPESKFEIDTGAGFFL